MAGGKRKSKWKHPQLYGLVGGSFVCGFFAYFFGERRLGKVLADLSLDAVQLFCVTGMRLLLSNTQFLGPDRFPVNS